MGMVVIPIVLMVVMIIVVIGIPLIAVETLSNVSRIKSDERKVKAWMLTEDGQRWMGKKVNL